MRLRVLRASFSGELGYEINVRSDHVGALLDRLWSAGRATSAVALRHRGAGIIAHREGLHPHRHRHRRHHAAADIGFGRGIERKAANFVGRRSLSDPATQDAGRLQLVGLIPADRRTLLPVGAQLANTPPPTRAEGHVTSSTLSAELGHPVALGMLSRGAARLGERIGVHHMGATIAADIVALPFVDPKGARVHG